MKLQLATACAVLSLSLAGSAFADGRVTATLETPQAGHSKFIASHAVWNCEADTCVAALAPDDAGNVSSCQGLAKKVGRVTAYRGFKPLDEKALAKCNTAAASAPTGAAKSASATVAAPAH